MNMKRIIVHLLILGIIISCGEAKTKQQENNPPEAAEKVSESDALPSADYSSLLQNYSCDMDIAEFAEALGVPQGDISIPDRAKEASYRKSCKCSFYIKGYGTDYMGNEATIFWSLQDGMSPSDVKKEIETYLKNQKEMPASVQKITGMGIELAETGDAYLAFQNKHGRVLILNEHYGAMLFVYSTKMDSKERTQEQVDQLKAKTIRLANYLLKKHRK